MTTKERPLRARPDDSGERTGWWLGRGFEEIFVSRRQLPALARLVAKMQAAETRRGKVRR